MDETLLTAARRAVRNFNIDMNKGGIITEATEHALQTLDLMVSRELSRELAQQTGTPYDDSPQPP